MNPWKYFKKTMKCERGFVISSAVVGSALITGMVAAGTITATTATVIGAVTAAAVYGAVAWGVTGLMKSGKSDGGQQQQQQDGFDPYAERTKAKASADADIKRKKIAMAKSGTKLSTPEANEDPKLGTTGLLGE